jgi:lysozyme family protein
MLTGSTGLRGPAPPFKSVQAEYQQLFDNLTVRPERIGQVKWYADRLVKNRLRYEAVTNETGVPWFMIGLTHALEASFNFLGHLHNGDVPLSKLTRNVPIGRPNPWSPPYEWERSAEDAVEFEHLTDVTDWSLTRTLYKLESYNGFGYRNKKIHTPYLWSYSNHYAAGKYVKDREWSNTAVSQQCGAAVILHELVRRGELIF